MEEELYLCEPLIHYSDFAIDSPGDMTWGSTIPAGIAGGTPYTRMIGMIVVFFRGCNR